ncbi:stage II sporulation protein P [Paenibacillus sp. LHD-117]|uniref:stage II sporulation protein P n=1 Tax=Paenibacillus sp. LHD-117 TaxID=3071412 RepID=UPI0027E1A97C|nr:stage II sporulation protein P [Paenibacillus sp. LHD-117]MDQ6419013.1 stage II sporulation protein P [Paenibacillus sp. LHD-117]
MMKLYKLREKLVSGTFFTLVCLSSMLVSVGLGLSDSPKRATYAAAITENAEADDSMNHAASITEMPFFKGMPVWDEALIAELGKPSSGPSTSRIVEAATPSMQPSPTQTAVPPDVSPTMKPSVKPAVKPTDKPSAKPTDKPAKKPVQIASSAPKILIYHSHNRESYYPELKKGTKDASSKTINVTMVGKRLSASLEKLGISTVHETTDYPSTVPKFNYAYSYKYSKQIVKEALSDHKELTFLFDIHRDSQKRKKTTAEINGSSYAKILFVIGQRNPNWEENKAFAMELHEAINAKYPGLSRGVLTKGAGTGNAEFNQSLSTQSLVVEIGGIENTLEENYRAADVLAEVINDLYGYTILASAAKK